MDPEIERLATLVRQLQSAWRRGAGSPEGVVTAPVGTAYLQSDGGAGTTLWIKETGTGPTGWASV
jgi:hypothetical protein